MFLKEQQINEITKQLSWIATTVELLNTLNLNSINVHSESFFCGLLNVVFGYQLHNLNTTEMNYTSIDLGDEKNKIAIQVTSEKTSTKIKETLRKFIEKGHYKKYKRLIIFIIGGEFVKTIFASFLNSNIYLLKNLLTSRVCISLETPYSKASSHFPTASH